MTEPSEQSQALFRLVVENVHDFAVYTKDLDGRTLSWNPGGERLFGYSEAEWVGLHVSVIFTREDIPRGEPDREMRTALVEGRAEDTRWHVRKDGSRFWANGLLMLLRDKEGEPRAFAKILRDDTARYRAEEELRAAKEVRYLLSGPDRSRAEGAREYALMLLMLLLSLRVSEVCSLRVGDELPDALVRQAAFDPHGAEDSEEVGRLLRAWRPLAS